MKLFLRIIEWLYLAFSVYAIYEVVYLCFQLIRINASPEAFIFATAIYFSGAETSITEFIFLVLMISWFVLSLGAPLQVRKNWNVLHSNTAISKSLAAVKLVIYSVSTIIAYIPILYTAYTVLVMAINSFK